MKKPKTKAKTRAKTKAKSEAKRQKTAPQKQREEARVLCPECGVDIALPPGVEEGRLLECPECGCSLEVVRKGTRLTVQTLERAEERIELERPEEEEFE